MYQKILMFQSLIGRVEISKLWRKAVVLFSFQSLIGRVEMSRLAGLFEM